MKRSYLKRSRKPLNKYSKSAIPKLKKKADTLFSRFIRKRDKICQKCRKTEARQCAHIFSRNNQTVRWDEENCVGMCYYCHIIWSHREPAEFIEWVQGWMGMERFEKLRKKSKILTNIFDMDINGIIEKYKEFN